MDINQLKSVVAIATLGNLSRAAESLHLSQPAVSAQIRQLEDELKVTLFERHARGMKPTPAGERVLAHAKTVLAAMDAIRDETSAVSGELAGTLVIGTVSGTTPLRLAEFLMLARERAPQVAISLIQTTSGNVLRNVLEGRFDAGFVEGDVEGADIASALLTHVEFVVAYPAQWKGRIDQAGLSGVFDLPWIGTQDDCSLHRLARALFSAHGRRFMPTVRTDQESLLFDLVAQGAGVSLLSKATIEASNGNDAVAVLPELEVKAGLQFVSSRHTPKQVLVSFAHRTVAEAWGLG